MALTRVPLPSPCYSSRGGAAIRLLVIHTTEGASSIESLGSWFANPANQVSSHAGADNLKPNTVGIYVQRPANAWTQGGANSVSVSLEICGYASWDSAKWNSQPTILDNVAQWLREESAATGVPLVRLTPAAAQGSGRGVCMHRDLGSWGGGHVDVGDGFPFDAVLAKAAGSSPTPPPGPQPSPITGEDMICTDPQTQGVWVVASKEGAVFTYDRAPYLGATNNTQMNAARYPCVGLDAWKDQQGQWGYVMVLDWGDRGDGKSSDGGERFRRYHFPRNGSGRATSGTY